MALRFIEITAGDDFLQQLEEWPGERPVIDWWQESGPQRYVVKVLVDASDSEALVDELVEVIGDDELYRVVSLAVEATLPRPEEEEEEEDEAGEAEEDDSSGGPILGRVSREELYTDMKEASGAAPLYFLQVVLSTIIACVGLIRGDTAVVVGAMVIAPLLGPNVALGLGATLGDMEFIRRALRTNVAGLLIALAVSVVAGLMLPFDAEIGTIAARTQAGIDDVILALATGVAGTLAVTSGMATALIGVMVAVALLPPLVAAGLLAGAGFWALSVSAFLLVVINVICVNLASVGTFVALGIGPRNWYEQRDARKSSRLALAVWTGALTLVLIILLLRTVL